MAAALTSTCFNEAPSLINRSDFTAILREHPVDTNKICVCAVAVVVSDKKIREYLNAERQTLMQRLESAQFRAYAGLRFTGAMFACIAPEFDASLAKSELPQ